MASSIPSSTAPNQQYSAYSQSAISNGIDNASTSSSLGQAKARENYRVSNDTKEWDQEPLYIDASRTSARADGITAYVHAPQSNPHDPTDVTAFHPGQAKWGPGTNGSQGSMPEILFRLLASPSWARQETISRLGRSAAGNGRPPAKRDANGAIIMESWPEPNCAPKPLYDFKILPDRIATNVELWRLEAWLRLDPRLQRDDIMARMSSPKPADNTINMRIKRFRDCNGLYPWRIGSSENKSTAQDAIFKDITQAEINDNRRTGPKNGHWVIANSPTCDNVYNIDVLKYFLSNQDEVGGAADLIRDAYNKENWSLVEASMKKLKEVPAHVTKTGRTVPAKVLTAHFKATLAKPWKTREEISRTAPATTECVAKHSIFANRSNFEAHRAFRRSTKRRNSIPVIDEHVSDISHGADTISALDDIRAEPFIDPYSLGRGLRPSHGSAVNTQGNIELSLASRYTQNMVPYPDVPSDYPSFSRQQAFPPPHLRTSTPSRQQCAEVADFGHFFTSDTTPQYGEMANPLHGREHQHNLQVNISTNPVDASFSATAMLSVPSEDDRLYATNLVQAADFDMNGTDWDGEDFFQDIEQESYTQDAVANWPRSDYRDDVPISDTRVMEDPHKAPLIECDDEFAAPWDQFSGHSFSARKRPHDTEEDTGGIRHAKRVRSLSNGLEYAGDDHDGIGGTSMFDGVEAEASMTSHIGVPLNEVGRAHSPHQRQQQSYDPTYDMENNLDLIWPDEDSPPAFGISYN